MLSLLLAALPAQAQHPAAPLLPPHPNSAFARTPLAPLQPSVDPEMIVTPPGEAEAFIRRWGAGADTVYAYLRLLPGTPPRTPFGTPRAFPLPDFRADSSVVPLFRLPDALRPDALRGFFERHRPGARLESHPDTANVPGGLPRFER